MNKLLERYKITDDSDQPSQSSSRPSYGNALLDRYNISPEISTPKPIQSTYNPDRENYIADKKKMLTDMYSKPTFFGLGRKRSDAEIQKLVNDNIQSYINNYDKEHPQTQQSIPTNSQDYKEYYKSTVLGDSNAPGFIKDYAANAALLNTKLQKNPVVGRFIQSVNNAGGQQVLNDNYQQVASPTTGNKILDMAIGIPVDFLANVAVNQGVGLNGFYTKTGQAAENLLARTPIKNTIAKSALKGGLENSIQEGMQSLSRGDNVSDIAKNTLQGAGTGLVFGGGLGAAGKGLEKIKGLNTSPMANSNLFKSPTESLNVKGNVIAPKTNIVPEMPSNTPKTKAMELQLFSDKKLDIPEVKKDINGIERMSQKIVSSSSEKPGIKQRFSNAYTKIVDSNNPLSKVDNKTYTLATNSKNSGSIVDYILKDGLVNRQGVKIGEPLKKVVQDIPKGQEKDFWEYALQRHNIDRNGLVDKANSQLRLFESQNQSLAKMPYDKLKKLANVPGDNGVPAREYLNLLDRVSNTKNKPILPDFSSSQSQIAVDKWEKLHPDWKNKADNVTNWIDSFMKEWGVNSGITSEDLYKELRNQYPSYIPTQRNFSELEKGTLQTNGKGFVDQKGVIKKAKGSSRDIIDPTENIMNLVNRTVRTAKYNEVGQSLLDAIERNPEGMAKYAEIIPEGEKLNPNVNNVVSVLRNGNPVNIQINDKALLDNLQGFTKPEVGPNLTKVKNATNIYKSLITQKNPVFAIRNIARDIPTAYVFGNEPNPLKFGADLFKAGKDLATNSDAAQQYKGLGGGGSNFFNSGNVSKSAKELTKTPLYKKALDKIETFNNITESAPRLAEFKRELARTGDPQKALFAANDVTTNFSRGGHLTKNADAVVPYLNAGVQGLDKLARQVKNKPLQTLAKGTIAVTTPTVALDLINKNNPNYQDLDNRTKDNYFLIPKSDGTFIKIPKSRELGVLFSSLFERISRKASGENDSFKGFGNTVATNFSPSNPLENNIASPLLALKYNKDFANRDIVPQSMQDLSPYNQYDEKTSEIAKTIGNKTNMSPKQIDYLIRSYTGVIGQLGLPAATKSNYGSNTTSNLLKPVTTQFTADPAYSSQSIQDLYDNYDKLKRIAADKNFEGNIPSKTLTLEEKKKNDFAKTIKDISDLNKEIKNTTDEEKIRQLRLDMIKKAIEANKKVN